MLSFRKLTLRRGPRVLLRELDATVHAGQRLGIVGRNGTGKSSLLAAIRGELGTDGGSIDLPGGITMASVAQESPSGPRSALDYVLDGDAEYRRIEQRLARAEASGDGDQLGALHERLLAIDGYAAPSRAGRLLHGLGFAGALSEVGLPPDEIPAALLAFNLGIEAGQLAFVAVVWLLSRLLAARLAAAPAWALRVPAHAMGGLAVYWCLDRGAFLFS